MRGRGSDPNRVVDSSRFATNRVMVNPMQVNPINAAPVSPRVGVTSDAATTPVITPHPVGETTGRGLGNPVMSPGKSSAAIPTLGDEPSKVTGLAPDS